MGAGLLMIGAGMALLLYNGWRDSRAGQEAGVLLARVEEQIPEQGDEILDIRESGQRKRRSAPDGGETVRPEPAGTETEMAVVDVDGGSYIGTLEIPSIKITLPIHSHWDPTLAKTAPCRYQGSAQDGSLIISRHNYKTHFGKLASLVSGEEIVFRDVDGNVFTYDVLGTETIEGDDVERMIEGDWDLTLFTCTVGGAKRVTVRCVLQEETSF